MWVPVAEYEKGTGSLGLYIPELQAIKDRLPPVMPREERNMAIPMPVQQDIRRLDRLGVPHARIARDLGIDRGTVAKYAALEDYSPRKPLDRRFGRCIDAFAPIVDGWLERDRMMPGKQRHTAKRIHERLVAECGFSGSYSAVQRYVKQWKEANRQRGDAYLRLEWAPGSMQVDFGVARAVIAGRERTVHFLVASFPYSNMRYAVAMPGENAECLCQGLVMLFAHVGGVPPVMVMDNATGAGHRDAKGELTLTALFESFVSHYLMEVRFCNPYSGNEKGNVENAVGFLRRNLMVPMPVAESFEQLSRILLERCDQLAASARMPADKTRSVQDGFDDDRAALMPLPSTVFDAVCWMTRKADKYGRIQHDNTHYLVGDQWARRRVLVGVRWDTVGLFDPTDGAELAEYPRSYGQENTITDPAKVLPSLALRPRAWLESEIRPDVPANVRNRLDQMDDQQRAKALKALDQASVTTGFQTAMDAAEMIDGQELTADRLIPLALRLSNDTTTDTGPDLSDYDRFLTI